MFLRVQRAVCSARQTRKAPARLCSGRPDQPSSSSSSSQIHAEKQRRRRRRDEAILSGPHSEAAGKTAKWSEKERISYRSLAPPGTKKDTGVGLPSAFSPDFVESGWYQWWEREGFFRPERHERLPQAVEKTFCLCIPPPNVTGSLHLGHALTVALQDALVRWRRMQGYRVLWVPGCDHAGIATQSVVERRLQREGRTRQQLKREEFLQEVWRWKEDKGDEIYHQLRALGASLDWSRTCFTMDPGYSRAVTAAFVRLSDAGLIYRSEALVNWSCALESAISDIEVEAVELSGVSTLSLPGYQEGVEFGTLTTFAYPVEGLEAEVSVSTTRPETMLGDVAVAVHPHDPRYQALHGKQCRHPFTNRLLPIITDPEVDMELGTGALKVTPAHDHTDFKLSQKHSLPRITVIGGDGTMTPSCGEWLQGVKRFTARQLVVDALVEKQLFRGKRSHAMTLPVCSRSGDVVEPLLKKQWFLRCQEMAQKALQAVEDGELEIVPQRHVKTWTNWLSNISDWCISRQLWWGHQIPAYRVRLPGHAQHADQEVWVCGHSQEEALHRAAVRHGVKPEDVTLTQDPDVLDTWFSSGLFPFAMLGWPRQTLDLQHFYPNSLLETGSDLIFFWVARMVMLGTELTGQLPFKQVLFHSLVRDKYGRKMSKSLGNVIDPLDVVHGVSLQGLEEKVRKGNLDLKEQQVALEAQRRDFPHGIPQCGADALRFALCSHRVQGEDISLSVSQVLSCRHFCNKMWQTVRFTLGALEGQAAPAGTPEEVAPLSSMDRWIGSRLYSTVLQCEEALEAYQLHTATAALHSFWVHSLCDVYMEYMKPLLHTQVDGGVRRAATAVLYHCVCVSLALLSPFMPFITEELWQRLQPAPPAAAAPSLSLQPYPRSSQLAHWYFPEEERDFLLVQEVVRVARSLRAQCGMTKERPAMSAVCSPSQARVLLHFQSAIEPLSRISSLHVHCPDRADLCGAAPLAGGLVGLVDHHCQLHLHVQGGKDVSRQIVHLSQKRDGLRPKVKELQLKVSSPQYRQKVPAHIQQQTDNRLSALLQELKSVEDQLEVLRAGQGAHGGHGGHGAR